MIRVLTHATLLWLACPAALVAAQPETRGTFDVAEWDAGRLALAGAMIRTRVVYPETAPGPFPLVGVIHGYARNGSYHLELARTLASRGFVALVPDMPCGLGGCDHDANADQLVALLEWGVAQGADPGSRIAGRVDPERRGLIGHSWGGLSSHLAAARDDRIDSLVLFDPNDDGTVGRDATATVRAPTLQLLAMVEGSCNRAWQEATVYPMLPAPKAQLTVGGSGHCDPEDPSDSLCGFACGSGDASTSSIFRRYAVAWTACILGPDPMVGEYVGGGRMMDDETAGRIVGVMHEGLDALPCRGGAPAMDAGTPVPEDGGTTPGTDGGTGPRADSGPGPGRDGGGPGRDGGAAVPVPGGDEGGCGCRLPSPASGSAPPSQLRALAGPGALLGLTIALGRRIRRRPRPSQHR